MTPTRYHSPTNCVAWACTGTVRMLLAGNDWVGDFQKAMLAEIRESRAQLAFHAHPHSFPESWDRSSRGDPLPNFFIWCDTFSNGSRSGLLDGYSKTGIPTRESFLVAAGQPKVYSTS